MTTPLADLAASGARITSLGLSPGASGNVSARIDNVLYISATGVALDEMTADNFARVSLEKDSWGAHLGGGKPSKELPLHLALYARSTETRSVVHLHSPSSVAASCLEPWTEWSALAPITPYFVMKVGQTPLIPYAAPGDQGQAAYVRELPLAFRAALIQNHGQITTGMTVSEATARSIELEEACRTTLALRGFDNTRTLSPEEAGELAHRYASAWGGVRAEAAQ